MKFPFRTSPTAVYILSLMHATSAYSFERKIPQAYTTSHLRTTQERLPHIGVRAYRSLSVTFAHQLSSDLSIPTLKIIGKNGKHIRHLSIISFFNSTKDRIGKHLLTPSFVSKLKICNTLLYGDAISAAKRLEKTHFTLFSLPRGTPFQKIHQLRSLRQLNTVSLRSDTEQRLCLFLLRSLHRFPQLKALYLDLEPAQTGRFKTVNETRLSQLLLAAGKIPNLTFLEINFPEEQGLYFPISKDTLKNLQCQLKIFSFSGSDWMEGDTFPMITPQENGTLGRVELFSPMEKISTPLFTSLLEGFEGQKKHFKLSTDMYSMIAPLKNGPFSKSLLTFFESLTHLSIGMTQRAKNPTRAAPTEVLRTFFTKVLPHLTKLTSWEWYKYKTSPLNTLNILENHLSDVRKAIKEHNFTSLEKFEGSILPEIENNPTFRPKSLILRHFLPFPEEVPALFTKNNLSNLQDLVFLGFSWEIFNALTHGNFNWKISKLHIDAPVTEKELKYLTECAWPIKKLGIALINPLPSFNPFSSTVQAVISALEEASWATTLKRLKLKITGGETGIIEDLNFKRTSFPCLGVVKINGYFYALRNNILM